MYSAVIVDHKEFGFPSDMLNFENAVIMDIEGFSFPTRILHRTISLITVKDPCNFYTYHFHTSSSEYDISKLTPAQRKTINFQIKLHGLNVEYKPQPETKTSSWFKHCQFPFVMRRIKSIAKFTYFKRGQIEKNLCGV